MVAKVKVLVGSYRVWSPGGYCKNERKRRKTPYFCKVISSLGGSNNVG